MPKDPAGNYTLPPGYLATPGTTIRAEQHNLPLQDVAQALSSSLDRAGRNGMVGPLDMGGFAIRNVLRSSNANDVATVGQGMPIGAVIDFAGENAPEGWLLCYGQQVSRASYPALFSAIGTRFGSGNGSTTFNLPDIRGIVIAGKDDMGGTSSGRLNWYGAAAITLGQTFGAASYTLTVEQMPAHNHGGSTSVGGGATLNYNTYFNLWETLSSRPGGSMNTPTTATLNVPAHSHSIPSQGGNSPFGIAQPTTVMNKIIKASY